MVKILFGFLRMILVLRYEGENFLAIKNSESSSIQFYAVFYVYLLNCRTDANIFIHFF